MEDTEIAMMLMTIEKSGKNIIRKSVPYSSLFD